MPRHLLPLAGLAAFAIPLFFFELGHYGLVNGDEGFYHYVARHMVETGDWFRVEFAGEHRLYDTFTHAPLMVWLKALVLLVAGDGYWSMRCLSATFALLSLFATYGLACRVANRRVALLAALLQLTTFQFVFIHSARTGEMEPLITCFLTLTPLLFLRAVEEDRSFVPHHLCLVALLNLKLALIVIPLAAELLYLVLTPAHRRYAVRWLGQAAWILPLGSSWHLYQMSLNWDPFLDTLSKMLRQASGPGSSLSGNAIYYANTLLWGGFPHSLFYPAGIASVVLLQRSAEARLRWLVLGLYSAAIFGFFVFVSLRHSWYVIPLYPFLSIAMASWLVSLATGAHRSWAIAAATGAVAVGLWARFPILSMNPFAVQATHVRAAVRWVGLGELGAGVCIGSSLLLFAGAGALLGRRITAGTSRILAFVLCVGTLGLGGARVVSPLRFTDYVSPLDGLARELDARRARGEAIEYPVPMPDWHWDRLMVRYYFADDYRIGRQRVNMLGKSIFVPILLAEREGTSR